MGCFGVCSKLPAMSLQEWTKNRRIVILAAQPRRVGHTPLWSILLRAPWGNFSFKLCRPLGFLFTPPLVQIDYVCPDRDQSETSRRKRA